MLQLAKYNSEEGKLSLIQLTANECRFGMKREKNFLKNFCCEINVCTSETRNCLVTNKGDVNNTIKPN